LLEEISLLFLGEIKQATAVLNKEWLLFFPSLYGFAIFDSYMNTVENNKLVERVQKNFFEKMYQHPSFCIVKGKKVE
jgi:hypothetical protein